MTKKNTGLGWVVATCWMLVAGYSAADTVVTSTGGSINGTNTWSNGLPSPSNPGTIGLNGNWATGADFSNWDVTQTAGTITRASGNMQMIGGTVWGLNGGTLQASAGMVRVGVATTGNGATLNMTGGNISASTILDLPNSASTFNMSGGSVIADECRLSNGAKANLSGGTGTFTGDLSLGNANSQVTFTGADWSFDGNLILTSTANLSTFVRLGAGDSSLSVGGLDLAGTGFIDFTSDSSGSLTVNGYTQTGFENLWTAQKLRVDEANTGAFSDSFSVSGDTLSLIPEPGTLSLMIISAGILWLVRFHRR